ncbi:hypothetical protein HD554DRAFT_2167047 [Boletus coccyginus]|nr:hypothetical protein HD554DRAFT_2167047 [Boletus coccyginus]
MALSLVTRNTTWQLFLNLVCYTAICPIMPRFIISIRELYDRDLHARWQGIDSRFGVLSQPIASETVAVSAIAIAEVATEQGQGGEGDTEAIGLEELGDHMGQVMESGDADNMEAIRLA